MSPAPLLAQLPASAAGLEFGALAGSPSKYCSSPYGSPLHGASLTHALLMTPVGSPLLGLSAASPQMRRPLRQQPHIFSTSPMASNSPGNLFASSPSYLTSGGSPSHLTSCGSPSYLTSGGSPSYLTSGVSPSYLTSGVSPSYLTSGFLRYPVASNSPKNLFAANSPSYSLANSLDISLPTASPSRPMAARVTSLGGRSLQPPPVSLRPSGAQPQTADQLI